MARYSGRTARLSLMLVLNFACFIMELTFGFLSRSMVLTADAFNVLSDFLGVVIALACMKIAAKGPSEKNTFGWMRCDVLGALINSVFMIALCVTIVIDSLQRFVQPEPVDQPRTVMIVGIVGLMVNLVGIFALKDYNTSAPKETTRQDSSNSLEKSRNSEFCLEKKDSSDQLEKNLEKTQKSNKGASSHMNMYGAYLHVLGDALGSVIVVICALVDWQVPNVPFLQNYLDPILSILMAIMLTISSVGLMKESSLTLLQAVPTKVNMMNLKSTIRDKSHHIIEVNNLHVWQLSSEKLVASVRVRFDDALPWDKMVTLINEVENCFYDEGIHVVTVQPEVLDPTDGHSVIVDGTNYDSVRRRASVASPCCRVETEITGVLVTSDIGSLRVSIHGQPVRPNEDVSVWM